MFDLLQEYIVSADWHIKSRNPKSRIDNFYISQKRKIRWILKLCNRLSIENLLIAGDMFDSSLTPYLCIGDYINIFLSKQPIKVLTIFGQHDLRYHSLKSRQNTPLSLFLSAFRLRTLDVQPYINTTAGIYVQGASWTQDFPKPIPSYFNILLIHKLVTHQGPLFPGQKEHLYTEARRLLDSLDFDVIISGDNHQSFYVENNGKLLINPGTIVRKTIAERDLQPRVGLLRVYQDHRYTFEWKNIPIEPSVKVFKSQEELMAQQEALELSPELKNFILSLEQHTVERPDFFRDLIESMELITDVEVKEIILDLIACVRQRIE